LPFFVKKELYHRHHHLATLVSIIYLCNPYPELGYIASKKNKPSINYGFDLSLNYALIPN